MGDEPVIATNDDASECKRGAVQLGYWSDEFIEHFIRRMEKRPPEINRGYYARVKGIEGFVTRFLKRAGPNAQIVSLGSGFDTLYWRLRKQGVVFSNYVELDFPTVTARKCAIIKRCRQLLEYIHVAEDDGEVRLSATDLHATTYHCVGTDLRSLPQLEAKIRAAEVDFGKPTLFLAECVLVYIDTDCCDNLLTWIATSFPAALFVNYEMCNMDDTFGDVMLGNLRARGCTLAGVAACRSLDTQKGRFLQNRWGGTSAWDMVEVYYAISSSERVRIEKIEFLDEQELLIQLFQHYCIAIAWTGPQFADIECSGNG